MNQQKVQQINLFLQQAHQYEGKLPPQVVPMLVAEFFDTFGKNEEAQAIREYKPEPDPMQMEMMKLELALKQAEVEKIMAEAQLAKAKSLNTTSQAYTHTSKADNIDMDTLIKKSEFDSIPMKKELDSLKTAAEIDKMNQEMMQPKTNKGDNK
jgi:hypothetical protein